MKHIIEFILPSDKGDLAIHMYSTDFFMSLMDIERHIRDCLKHGHHYKDADEALEFIRTLITDKLGEIE